MNKRRVMTAINEMPQEFSLDAFMEKLIFIEKVEKGLEQLDAGNTFTHDEVKRKVKEWQK